MTRSLTLYGTRPKLLWVALITVAIPSMLVTRAEAAEITENLRQLDPDDPLKYDFALHKLGLTESENE